MIHRMEPTISPMRLCDYDEVVAFWSGKEGIGLNESDSRGQIGTFLERNAGLSLVARADGKIVGAVMCGHDGRRGYLHHLAVDPAVRKQGLGRRLVEECLKKLKAAGIQKCNVFLFDSNVEGRVFWQRVGFEAREDLLLMQTVLIGKKCGKCSC